MLDFHKLRIFLTVVQAGSFSEAGHRLLMTQSAVSQHIKELESSIGRRLFERGWRGVRLTAYGEVLNKYASQIFALIHEAETALTDVEKLVSGRLSIGATPGIGVYLAPEWVQRFRASYPQLTVALQTGVTASIIADVAAQRLEIGFIEGELDSAAHAEMIVLELQKIEQHVVVGAKHPFWERQSLPLEALNGQSMIVRQPTSQSRIWLDRALQQHGISVSIDAEFDNLESMKRSVAMGTCLAIMPPYVVQNEIEQGTLRMLPIVGAPLTRRLKLIRSAHAPITPIMRVFLADLSQQYSALRPLVQQLSGVVS